MRLKTKKTVKNKTFHLAIDLGATSGRAILASANGTEIEMKEIHRFKYPMIPVRGHLFWNLPLIYEETLVSLTKCAILLREIDETASLSSIGIDSWGCDVAYFYKDGSPAGLPYCYRDSHTLNAAEQFCKKFGKEKVYEKTGIQFMDFNTLFQLYTIQRENPDLIEVSDKILFIPDAINYMLTGKAKMEYTIASTSQILNPNTKDLDEDLLKAIGIARSKFGEIVMPGTIIGNLTEEIQKVTGLGPIPVVAVAGHDTASAVVGIPSLDQNFAYLSCGTWSLLGVELPEPIISNKSLERNFTNEGGISGTVRFLKNICGLWILERCRNEFKNAPNDISDLSALCNNSQCDSIINPDDAIFVNPENMMEAIKKSCEKSSQRLPESTADYVRIIFRSLAHRYGEILDMLKELTPIEINHLHVIGGGSQNQYLMQMTADILGLPIVAGPSESTALGNILVQLMACGIVEDLPAMRKISVASTETKTYYPRN